MVLHRLPSGHYTGHGWLGRQTSQRPPGIADAMAKALIQILPLKGTAPMICNTPAQASLFAGEVL